jgi:hypothetical protein
MSYDFEDNATEGPEGYFVNSSSATLPGRVRREDRREHRGGRRLEDVQMRRAQRRLLWINATLGAILTAAAVMAVAERLESPTS